MMDCKKALGACDGDTEKAMDWLRAKGIARAASAAERVATEGLVGIFTDSRGTMLVEVNSETDFVGKNSDFHDFVGVVARAAAEYSSAEGGKAVTPEQLLAHNGGTIQNALGLAVASIRENIVIKRVAAGTWCVCKVCAKGRGPRPDCRANTLMGSVLIFFHFVSSNRRIHQYNLVLETSCAATCTAGWAATRRPPRASA